MKKRLFKIFTLSLCFALCVSAVACKKADFPSVSDDTKYIAHRGYSNANVDNTEASYLEASTLDFYGIETDVKVTSDGFYVCNHDDTAVFEDGTELVVKNSTRAELLEKRLKGATKDTEYMCTFERYLEICKESQKVAIIEFKTEFTDAQIEEIFEIVNTVYTLEKAVVIDFDFGQIKRAKKINDSIPYQYLIGFPNFINIDYALKNGINLSFNKTVLNIFPGYIKRAHKNGLEVGVWTVDDKQDIANFIAKGVDYVTSNEFYGNFN